VSTEKAAFGIAGLDDITGGGLKRGHLFLLEGSPGTGKTTIATQFLIGRGQIDDTFKLAAEVLDDREDLIHKASGWMLREAGKRVSEDGLLAFLDQHATQMPRTMLRYAIERLDPAVRKHYLALR